MKATKQGALYLHKPGTDYECRDCMMFVPARDRCTIHGPTDAIHAGGACGFWVFGPPMPGPSHGNVTKLESGYVESPRGFSCKRCTYFLPDTLDCRKVDRNSEGDDEGQIHPDACCNEWEERDEPAPVGQVMKRLIEGLA